MNQIKASELKTGNTLAYLGTAYRVKKVQEVGTEGQDTKQIEVVVAVVGKPRSKGSFYFPVDFQVRVI